MSEIRSYIVDKPVHVYVVGGYEIEANLLYDAVVELKAQIEYADERGTRKIDYEVGSALKAAGLVKPGLMTGALLPTEAFAAFCVELDKAQERWLEQLEGITPPTFVWRIQERPDAPTT